MKYLKGHFIKCKKIDCKKLVKIHLIIVQSAKENILVTISLEQYLIFKKLKNALNFIRKFIEKLILIQNYKA